MLQPVPIWKDTWPDNPYGAIDLFYLFDMVFCANV